MMEAEAIKIGVGMMLIPMIVYVLYIVILMIKVLLLTTMDHFMIEYRGRNIKSMAGFLLILCFIIGFIIVIISIGIRTYNMIGA